MFLSPFFLALLVEISDGSLTEFYNDETIISLPNPINDVLDAYEFAYDRIIGGLGVYDAKLTSIEIRFANEAEVKERRGTLLYRYTINIDSRHNSTAHGKIAFDMKHNTSTSLDVYRDTRGGRTGPEGWRNVTPLDFSKWTLTLDEVFEIIYEESGAEIISRMRIWCERDYWLINVSYLEPVNNTRLFIDPITRELWPCYGFCFVNCYSGCS